MKGVYSEDYLEKKESYKKALDQAIVERFGPETFAVHEVVEEKDVEATIKLMVNDYFARGGVTTPTVSVSVIPERCYAVLISLIGKKTTNEQLRYV